LKAWREHFVIHDNMLQIEATNLTAEIVLKTSGHVDRFTDNMVKDPENGECFRADKLLEDAIDRLIEATPTMSSKEREEHEVIQRQADAYTPEELGQMINKYGITSPSTGNKLTEPFPFNLMFKTTIGPEGNSYGYLRPETAQGIFLNFKRLLEFNAGKMPFAGAQIGYGFRNEIAPRAGLLRVREFCMAEIEHFVNPADKSHAKVSGLQGQS
jgi:glycyl-tRNA synthetase